MSSGSYYEEEMSSGGHRRLTAFILWPFPLSKKSPLDPPSPWSWLGAYPWSWLGAYGERGCECGVDSPALRGADCGGGRGPSAEAGDGVVCCTAAAGRGRSAASRRMVPLRPRLGSERPGRGSRIAVRSWRRGRIGRVCGSPDSSCARPDAQPDSFHDAGDPVAGPDFGDSRTAGPSLVRENPGDSRVSLQFLFIE